MNIDLLRICAAFLIMIAVSVLTGLVWGTAFSGLSPAGALLSLVLGFAVAVSFIKLNLKTWNKVPLFRHGFWSWVVVTLFALFSLRSFLWVTYQEGGSIKILSPYNTGDLSLHFSFINYLSSGIKFWPESPIFCRGGIHYPIGMDLFNALLYLCGVSIERGLVWVGLILSFVTLSALMLWGGAFVVAGFLFNSGGFKAFYASDAILAMSFQHQALAWKSFFLTLLLPQRGMLFAIPAGLLLFSSFRARFFSSKENRPESSKFILPFWAEFLFYFSMPLFHFHTFIFISLMLLIWSVIFRGECLRYAVKLWAASVIPASCLTFLLTDGFGAVPAFRWKWGWEQGKSNFFEFWSGNFGLFPLLVIGALILCVLKKSKSSEKTELLAWGLPATGLFILFYNLMLSPWSWDNIKLLMWPYLLLFPFVWSFLKDRALWLRFILCALLFYTGFWLMIAGVDGRHGYDLFNAVEVRQVESALRNNRIPPEARFAAFSDYPNHPLLCLGKKMVIGHYPWVWSHGVPMAGEDKKLDRLMRGEKNWLDLAKDLGVDYLYWGPRESQKYPDSKKPWTAKAKRIARGPWGELYKIDQPT